MSSLLATQSLENLSPGSNLNLDIYIEEVLLNHSTTEVGVMIVGIVGDKYTLKVSETVTNTVFHTEDINYRSRDTFSCRVDLEKDKTYTFTLFDLHNIPLDTYTIEAPVDFTYVESVVAVVPASTPAPVPVLPETADCEGFVPGLIVCVVLFIIVGKLYFFGRGFR